LGLCRREDPYEKVAQISGKSSRIPAIRDYSRLSCGVAETQLDSPAQKAVPFLGRRPSILNSLGSRQRPDCLAGVGGLELRNVGAKYPFERSHRFPVIQPNFGRRDYSRSSCGANAVASGGADGGPVGRSYAETRVSGEPEFYPPVAFRRAPAARKSASDDRFIAGARLRWYLSRRSALPARAHIASDGVTVPARWPSRSRRAAPSFRRRW
jgi:hypothetical protein